MLKWGFRFAGLAAFGVKWLKGFRGHSLRCHVAGGGGLRT